MEVKVQEREKVEEEQGGSAPVLGLWPSAQADELMLAQPLHNLKAEDGN